MMRRKHLVGIASLFVGGMIAGCGSRASDEDGVATARVPLRGGDLIVGATGVVDFGTSAGSGCTGSMIAPNVVLAAAHCFDTAGAKTAHDGTLTVDINYYDPAAGRRPVYLGVATWHVVPTYNGTGPVGPGGSNDDMSVLVIPSTFAGTDYHDYLRIYADQDGPLNTNLTAYGAGMYNYSGADDNNLRTSWFEVQSLDINHIVVDSRELVGLCKGYSGGPLIKFATHAGVTFPTVVGVFSKLETDDTGEGTNCTNNDPPNDDDYYCRANSTRIGWIQSMIGRGCDYPASTANLVYRRCFDTAFIEDVPGEGLELGQEVAIFSALL